MSRIKWITPIFVFGILALGACGSDPAPLSSTSQASASTGVQRFDTKIRMGLAAPSVKLQVPMLAQDEGYFKAEGLDNFEVSVIPGPQLVPAVAGGAAEIAISAAPAGDLIAMKSGALKVVAGYAANGQYLIVAPGINSIEDLRGKTIGINGSRGSSGAMLMHYALRDAGMNFDDVKVQTMADATSQIQAYLSDQIVAMVSPPPLSDKALEGRAGSKILREFPDLPYFTGVEVVVNAKWAQSHRAEVVAVLKALNRALETWHADPELAKSYISKNLKYSAGDPAIDALYDDSVRWVHKALEPVTSAGQAKLFQMLRDNGFPEATDELIPNSIDESYLDEASISKSK